MTTLSLVSLNIQSRHYRIITLTAVGNVEKYRPCRIRNAPRSTTTNHHHRHCGWKIAYRSWRYRHPIRFESWWKRRRILWSVLLSSQKTSHYYHHHQRDVSYCKKVRSGNSIPALRPVLRIPRPPPYPYHPFMILDIIVCMRYNVTIPKLWVISGRRTTTPRGKRPMVVKWRCPTRPRYKVCPSCIYLLVLWRRRRHWEHKNPKLPRVKAVAAFCLVPIPIPNCSLLSRHHHHWLWPVAAAVAIAIVVLLRTGNWWFNI